MKKSILSALFIFSTPLAFSTPVIPPVDIHEDFFSADGIQFTPVEEPTTIPETTSVPEKIQNKVTLMGTGTVTVGSSHNEEFPRLQLTTNNNTITRTKTRYTKTLNDAWDGTIKAPQAVRQPSNPEITTRVLRAANSSQGIPEKRADVTPLKTYVMGGIGETFEFSRTAIIAFPVDRLDGTKIWFAVPKSDNTWEQTTQTCVVKDKICEAGFNRITQVMLLQEALKECPNTEIENGKWGTAPECRIVCDSDYEPNSAGTQCVEIQNNVTLADLEAENNEGVETSNIIVEPTTQEENITPITQSESNTNIEEKTNQPVIEAQSHLPKQEEIIIGETNRETEQKTEVEVEIEEEITIPETLQSVTAEETQKETVQEEEILTNQHESQFDITEVVEEKLLPAAPKEAPKNNYALGATLPKTGSAHIYLISFILVIAGLFLVQRKRNL